MFNSVSTAVRGALFATAMVVGSAASAVTVTLSETRPDAPLTPILELARGGPYASEWSDPQIINSHGHQGRHAGVAEDWGLGMLRLHFGGTGRAVVEVVDACDTGNCKSVSFGPGAVLNERRSNGASLWTLIDFEPGEDRMATFSTTLRPGLPTTRQDGFGVVVPQVAPIPLPPAAALLLTGVAALAGLRRRLMTRERSL